MISALDLTGKFRSGHLELFYKEKNNPKIQIKKPRSKHIEVVLKIIKRLIKRKRKFWRISFSIK